MWSSKRSATPAHIRRLCTLGLPMEGIVPALLRALCREVHCDAGVVLWFDEHGDIANLYAPHLPAPAAMAAWFRPLQDPHTASSLPPTAAGPLHRSEFVVTCADDDDDAHLRVGTRPEPFCPHRRLCGMATPSGAPLQRLCSAVVRHGVPIASLMVYRPAGTTPFSGQERTAVKAAGRYLSLNAHSLPADTSAAMYRAGGEQGFLLCDPDGRVLRASANGYELLAQASGCAINRRTVPDELERAGRQLIRRLLADESLHATHDSSRAERPATLVNAWGLFRLRVFFEPDGPQGVLIERVEHLLVRLVAAMWHLDLSVQQGEVLLLLAQGLSHDRIAERMGVSSNTADYHIRQLYSKLSAHTRNEAIAYALGTLEVAHAS
jgi:DNA-binding CsgD family transcriptional regulator